MERNQFYFFIRKATNIINKNPIGFKEHLRSTLNDDLPTVITLELLIRESDSPAVNVIPELQVMMNNICYQ